MLTNYYKILGISSSATEMELRRAYRILARRYHPDVNPGGQSIERFKLIAEAYSVLNDADKRQQYDLDLKKAQQSEQEKVFAKFKRQESEQIKKNAKERYYQAQKADYDKIKEFIKTKNPAPKPAPKTGLNKQLKNIWSRITPNSKSISTRIPPIKQEKTQLIEISLSMQDAILGVRKTIEIPSSEGLRKINVNIPAGVYNGSIIRTRDTKNPERECILSVRVANHIFLSMEKKGLVLELPITIREALAGASIKIPTFDEPVLLKVPKGSQSGTELRVKQKGILIGGVRGDLYVRLMIQIPNQIDNAACTEAAKALDDFYRQDIRSYLPNSLS